jgi:hypothetical protein
LERQGHVSWYKLNRYFIPLTRLEVARHFLGSIIRVLRYKTSLNI